MAQRGIREYDAKSLLAKNIGLFSDGRFQISKNLVLVDPETDIKTLPAKHPWLMDTHLVVKPDQLFGKRGKNELILLDATFDQVEEFIQNRMNKTMKIGRTRGVLTHFLIEPFIPHEMEFYIAIKTERDGDNIYFSNHGGVDIEEVWDTVATIHVPVGTDIKDLDIQGILPKDTPGDMSRRIANFIKALFRLYLDLGFAYLEINPFVITGAGADFIPLDMVARLDDTAEFECGSKWGDLAFPAPFGRILTGEEQYIKDLDEGTGASLKLTVLNPEGRIWTMVAGGGASVIYADTIVDLGNMEHMANYGEYSGNPSTEFTYKYARTILDLMTREKDPNGKILLIGGGIANFTDVAKTFTGIIQALEEYKDKIIENNIKIFVRRGGPNFPEGLQKMRDVGERCGFPIEVYGPETHMTRIVSLALPGQEG